MRSVRRTGVSRLIFDLWFGRSCLHFYRFDAWIERNAALGFRLWVWGFQQQARLPLSKFESNSSFVQSVKHNHTTSFIGYFFNNTLSRRQSSKGKSKMNTISALDCFLEQPSLAEYRIPTIFILNPAGAVVARATKNKEVPIFAVPSAVWWERCSCSLTAASPWPRSTASTRRCSEIGEDELNFDLSSFVFRIRWGGSGSNWCENWASPLGSRASIQQVNVPKSFGDLWSLFSYNSTSYRLSSTSLAVCKWWNTTSPTFQPPNFLKWIALNSSGNFENWI